jgi:hypothetical protein
MLFIPIQGGKLQPVPYTQLGIALKEDDTTIEKVIKDMFTDFFNYSQVSKATTDRLSTTKVGNDILGIENVHEVFGPLLLSLYTNTMYKRYTEPSNMNPLYDYLTGVLKERVKSEGKNYGMITDASRAGMTAEDSEDVLKQAYNDQEETMYFAPTGFHRELMKIANLMVFTEGRMMSQFTYSVRDKKIYLDQVDNTIGYKLQGGNNDTLVDVSTAWFSNPHENHNARGSVILNPIMGRKGFISGVHVIGGLKSGNTGADLSDMTERDNYDLAMAMFLEHKDKSPETFAFKPVRVMLSNQGHRNQQNALDVNFNLRESSKITGSNGILIMDKDGKLKMDYDNIMLHISQGFAMVQQAQDNSLNRWVRFLSTKNVGITEADIIDATNPQSDIIRNNTFRKVMEILTT